MTDVESPKTPAEWQAAVDGAKALLEIDSARQFGLIEGGPEINFDRCLEILALGRSRGFEPVPDAAARFIAEFRPSSQCCSAPVVPFHRGGPGRPSKNEGRPCCSRCGKWCDEYLENALGSEDVGWRQ